jgi:hypothetical protein
MVLYSLFYTGEVAELLVGTVIGIYEVLATVLNPTGSSLDAEMIVSLSG